MIAFNTHLNSNYQVKNKNMSDARFRDEKWDRGAQHQRVMSNIQRGWPRNKREGWRGHLGRHKLTEDSLIEKYERGRFWHGYNSRKNREKSSNSQAVSGLATDARWLTS